jgi:hypothetical protein
MEHPWRWVLYGNVRDQKDRLDIYRMEGHLGEGPHTMSGHKAELVANMYRELGASLRLGRYKCSTGHEEICSQSQGTRRMIVEISSIFDCELLIFQYLYPSNNPHQSSEDSFVVLKSK